ncbi:MAG: type II secretion system F family protein [Proteobacteria bacterium]|nr:type II secretion system F family protein [Pseudomonadota bacterium]
MAIRVLGIDHVVLRVRDIERALAFYRDVLGCREERRVDDIGLVQLRAGRALIDLVDVASPLGREGGAAPGKEGRNVDHIALRIPIFGGVIMKSNLFSLTTNMVTMLEAGVPVIESLRLTEQSMGNTVLKRGLRNVIENASQGVKLGQAFSEEKVFPSLLSQAIAIGELRGSVVDTLRGLSNYYEQQTNRAVSGMTEMVQPVITVVIAVLVGFVAVAVISGIYSTITSIE